MKKCSGFTIIEVLVASVVIVLLAGLIAVVIGQSSSALQQARSTVQEFGAAQRAFDLMTRRIGSATLNAYRENRPREGWRPASELRFVSGQMQKLDPIPVPERAGHGIFFQAPRDRRGHEHDVPLGGMDELLNSWGYFVEVSRGPMPDFMEGRQPSQVRPQLMEMREPSARLQIYGRTNGKPDYLGLEWLHDLLAGRTHDDLPAGRGRERFKPTQRAPFGPMTPNIAVLIILPRLSKADAASIAPDASDAERAALLAPEYFYHSAEKGPVENLDMRHRLPPQIELTMIALDDATVAKNYTAENPDPFGVLELFHEARRVREDLHALEGNLIARRTHYRIFTTVITTRSSP